MECDNEFEHALLAAAGMDFATWRASRPPVFLVSVAMWVSYLRHLREGLLFGISRPGPATTTQPSTAA